MSKTDFSALQKWNKIPKDMQRKILDNVFCSNCYVTTIVDYTMSDEKHRIVIRGKCKKCGKDIARVVDND
jgi:hypothetical protein